MHKALDVLRVLDPQFTATQNMPRGPQKEEVVNALLYLRNHACAEILPTIRRIVRNDRAHYKSMGFRHGPDEILGRDPREYSIILAIFGTVYSNMGGSPEERLRFFCHRWPTLDSTDIHQQLDFVECQVLLGLIPDCFSELGTSKALDVVSRMVVIREWMLYDDRVAMELEEHRKSFWELGRNLGDFNAVLDKTRQYIPLHDPPLEKMYSDMFFFCCGWSYWGIDELQKLTAVPELHDFAVGLLKRIEKDFDKIITEVSGELNRLGVSSDDKLSGTATRYRKITQTKKQALDLLKQIESVPAKETVQAGPSKGEKPKDDETPK